MEARPGRTQNQQKAGEVRARFADRVGAIRSNARLTRDGKAAAIGREYLAAKSALSKLRGDEVSAPKQRRDELHQEIFGLPKGADVGTIIAYRDARDRASQLTKMDDAVKLATSAQKSGDMQLLTAVIERSVSQGWKPILKVATSDAEAFPKFEQLAELVNASPALNGSTPTLHATEAFERGQAFSLDRPGELSQFNGDEAIAAMVDRIGVDNGPAEQKSEVERYAERALETD